MAANNNGGLRIDDLLKDLDIDGDGDIDEQDKQLAATLKNMDSDGNGMITIRELVSIGENRISDKRKIKKLRRAMMVAIALGIVLCGVFIGLVVVANEASKDSKPSTGGVLKTIGGKEVTMSQTTTALSLLAMPALSLEGLGKVKELRVKETSGAIVKFTITGYKWFSQTSMIFYSARGDQVLINDGEVLVAGRDGKTTGTVARKRRALLSTEEGEQGTIEGAGALYANNCNSIEDATTCASTLDDFRENISANSDGSNWCKWSDYGMCVSGGACNYGVSCAAIPCESLDKPGICHFGGPTCKWGGWESEDHTQASSCVDTAVMGFDFEVKEANGNCDRLLSETECETLAVAQGSKYFSEKTSVWPPGCYQVGNGKFFYNRKRNVWAPGGCGGSASRAEIAYNGNVKTSCKCAVVPELPFDFEILHPYLHGYESCESLGGRLSEDECQSVAGAISPSTTVAKSWEAKWKFFTENDRFYPAGCYMLPATSTTNNQIYYNRNTGQHSLEMSTRGMPGICKPLPEEEEPKATQPPAPPPAPPPTAAPTAYRFQPQAQTWDTCTKHITKEECKTLSKQSNTYNSLAYNANYNSADMPKGCFNLMPDGMNYWYFNGHATGGDCMTNRVCYCNVN